MTRIFVYGTLKRGFSNATELAAARFERAATTARGYALHIVFGYPALVRSAAGVVHGELYRVTDEQLRRLDVFEGENYRREVIVLDDGSEAQAYVVGAECVADAERIESGRFVE